MQLIEFKNTKKEVLRGLFEKTNNSLGVVFVHGFERTSVEEKFRRLAEGLRKKANTFRFDFSGNGLSDGNFSTTSFDKWKSELEVALRAFKKANPKIQRVHLVAHSVAACIVLSLLPHKMVDKIVFLSPAFNQKELLRFWFTKSQNKEKNISWENYREFFDEASFQKDLTQKLRLTKTHSLLGTYHREASVLNFQEFIPFVDPKKILLIHGDKDTSVPKESNDDIPQNIKILLVKGGDHDLERPDMFAQYQKKLLHFLLT